MDLQILIDIVKYFFIGIIFYLAFKFLPIQNIPDKDVLLITLILTLIYIGVDKLQKLFNKNTTNDITACSKYCSVDNSLNVEKFSVNDESKHLNSNLNNNLNSNLNHDLNTENKNDINHTDKKVINETKSKDGVVITRYSDNSYSITPPNDSNIQRGVSRDIGGVLKNEIKYDKNYNFYDLTTLPMPEGVNPDDLYEEGYSFIPPKDWYPLPPHPPICVTNKKSAVCPNLTTGLGTNLKEWNESRRVTGPDSINTEYIKDKLNSGA